MHFQYVGRNVRPRFVTDCTHNDVAASIEEVLPTEEMNPAEVHCEVEQERWLKFCLVVTEKQRRRKRPLFAGGTLFEPEELCWRIRFIYGRLDDNFLLQEVVVTYYTLKVAKPDDLFSLNNGRLTTSFLDSLPTATGENVQKAMSCILVHGSC
ncbi:hypothetical protein Tco_0520929 [Tanacetum coccineum]